MRLLPRNTLGRAVVLMACVVGAVAMARPQQPASLSPGAPMGSETSGIVSVASLVYANDRSAVCFSSNFLADIESKTNVRTNPVLQSVSADSQDLFGFPFAVMTGEKSFTLTEAQRQNLRDYLQGGGFLVASAGCSSREWSSSFQNEIARIFPEKSLKPLEMTHPIFRTVYSIGSLRAKHRATSPQLEGLEIDGRIAVIFSADGLNDTAHAGGKCCCCGGDEIVNAGEVNVNLLAYALTH